MLELLTDPNAWASLVTLTVLEVVLGIDNIIFLSIVSAKLPAAQQPLARRLGLGGALAMRIAFLSAITWIIGLTQPVFSIGEHAVSWRDMVLVGGGLVLLYKGTGEVHATMEGHEEEVTGAGKASFGTVIFQIMLLDLVFSLDSIITAVGMTIAIGVMLFAAEPTAAFVARHPTVKMLALAFLLLVGVALIADGLHFHIPRGYLYFAIAFSLAVESLNLLAAARRKRRAAPRKSAAAE